MKREKVMVANRGEIAIRIFRACVEIGVRTVGVYTYEDRYSLHRHKADECYQIGENNEPLKPYLDMDAIIKVAKENWVDASHPGYGFLSENAAFAQKCAENDLIFVGPKVSVLKALGDKITAKEVATANNVPIIESSHIDLTDISTALSGAGRIGYPLILKAASGGGGRGDAGYSYGGGAEKRISRSKAGVPQRFRRRYGLSGKVRREPQTYRNSDRSGYAWQYGAFIRTGLFGAASLPKGDRVCPIHRLAPRDKGKIIQIRRRHLQGR